MEMRKVCLTALGCAAALILLDAKVVRAVPAFARREGVACQMCHFRVPELNEDGHAYLRRGLREEPSEGQMEGMEMGERAESAPAATPRPLGVPLNLQWANYLSVMGHHDFTAERGERPKFDAGAIDLWMGGPLNLRWSGLTNSAFEVEENGASVDVAYGHYITRWASRFGSGRFGQVMPFAILFNQGGPSMPLSTPAVLSMPGGAGSSWTPTTLLRGLEVGGINLPRWDIYLGAGQPHLEGLPEDAENHTDIYASAERLLGASDNSLTAYAYWGHAWLSPVAPKRAFHRYGAFGNAYWKTRTKGVIGYLAGTDKAEDGRSLDNSGWFLLGEYLFDDRWAGYARWDRFRRDMAAGGSETTSGPALGVSWWAATEIRLTLEAQFLKTTGQRRDRLLTTELLWIF